MTSVPSQEPRGGDEPRARPPVHPSGSEACRLLCAGVHHDEAFRDAVIDHLYVRENRIVAPSAGFDATRVLAHALWARKTRLQWAAGVLACWVLAVYVTRGVFLLPAMAAVYIGLARAVRGTSAEPPFYRVLPALLMRWYGRFFLVAFLVVVGGALFGGTVDWFDDGDSSSYDSSYSYDSSGSYGSYESDDGFSGSLLGVFVLGPSLLSGLLEGMPASLPWLCLLAFAGIAALLGLQRDQWARLMGTSLSPQHFADPSADPAERSVSGRFRRLRDRIRVEQHSPLIMYNEADPFCGSGDTRRAWNLSVELRSRTDTEAEPLDNATILRRIVPLLEGLRVPSPHGSPQAAEAVRDRLRELQVDECVFLPVRGLPRRQDAPYGPEGFETHRRAALEEGGEGRRHFLRIRVGGWGEEVVVTVYVRVHTQGGMLMLEVAPHLLKPLLPYFRDADLIAHQHRNNNWFGKAYWAAGRVPDSLVGSLTTLFKTAAGVRRQLTEGFGGALPEGPGLSVRELASDAGSALFQEMDVDRYLKSIEDRVTSGVRLALREAGWQTDEFEQKIIQVGAGGVFIESAVDSAIGIGDHNTVTSDRTRAERRDAPDTTPDPGPGGALRSGPDRDAGGPAPEPHAAEGLKK
ncbi:hypothetical protein OG233_11570 [Streptomyces sp. NBC_01218]|uniref:hypothetical protein n=1 Tax=Streptomyces sp. NBC_01218 TaxID=2903780 RepID=UPI002E1117B4|nr:hypothetical protein OG233_11570 [Streptomyces sp. NBC_01218]